jgi:hypothetical protein
MVAHNPVLYQSSDRRDLTEPEITLSKKLEGETWIKILQRNI